MNAPHPAFPAPPAAAADFTIYARSLMLSRGSLLDAVQEAETARSQRAATILRSAVAAGTTADSDWAGALVDYRIAEAGFVESLRQVGVWDRLYAEAMRRIPFAAGRIVASTQAVVGAAVGEAAIKPITMLSFLSSDLPRLKASTIVVVSAELMRAGGSAADSLLSRELRNGTVAATDKAFLDAVIADATPIAGSADPVADLRAAVAAITIGSTSRLTVALSGAMAAAAALAIAPGGGFLFPQMTPTGGVMAGMPAIPTDQLDADQALVIDASQLIGASDPVVLDTARQASLVLDDAPAPGTASTVNLWQLNLLGLRAERSFAFVPSKPTGYAALIDGATWGAGP